MTSNNNSQECVAMINVYITRSIKTLMMATPFVSMILMVMALWGIGGKTTYTDMKTANQEVEFNAGEAKNILVNETKSSELSSSVVEAPKFCTQEEKSEPAPKKLIPKKVQRGLVV